MVEIETISGRGKPIICNKTDGNFHIKWGKSPFAISKNDICRILNEYFADSDEWHPLGASMDKPIKGGFGEYVQNNFDKLSSRHASAIAAILLNEGLILAKGKKPIYLKRHPQKMIDLKV